MNLKYTQKHAGLGESERHILDTLSCLGKPVICAADLEKELGYSRAISNLALSRLTQKGWLQRVKSGIYRIVPLGTNATLIPDDAWPIAMELFSPCYISGWTAAEYWDLTEQIFNTTIIFTGQKQRRKDIILAGLHYRTKSIDSTHIFGTHKVWSSNTPILIADLHRTIIDVLDDPEIGGGGRHTIDIIKAYIKHKDANSEILFEYAEKLEHGAVFKRLGFITDKLMHLSNDFLDKIHLKINTGIIKLDPHGPNVGPINTKWGIRINIPLGDLL